MLSLLQLVALTLAPAPCRATPPRVLLRVAADVPHETAARIESAVGAALAGTAEVDASEQTSRAPLCTVAVAAEKSSWVLTLRARDLDGTQARRISSSEAPELSALHISSIVHAFVLAALARAPTYPAGAPAVSTELREDAVPIEPSPDAAQAVAVRSAGRSVDARPRGAESNSDAAAADSTRSRTRPEPTGTPARREPTPVESEPTRAARARKPASRVSAETREVLAPSADVLEPASSAVIAPRAWLSGLYTGSSVAPELVWQSGVRIEGAVRLYRGLIAGIGYGIFPRVALARADATASVRDDAFGIFAGWRTALPPFALSVQLGYGAHRTQRDTRWVEQSLTATDGRVFWSSSLLARVLGELRWRKIPGFALMLAPGLEIVVDRTAIIVAGDPETALLSPHLLRARLDVGASFDVL